MIQNIDISHWRGPFNPDIQKQTLEALEKGAVIFLPNLSFQLQRRENKFLNAQCLKENSKNISFNAKVGSLQGTRLAGEDFIHLQEMMERYFIFSRQLIEALIPQYQSHLIIGRTSFRPKEVEGRKLSKRKDDTRLHVDAFPATPNHGKRILRVFSNVNPEGKSRLWHLGEPFETVLDKFSHTFRSPIPFSRKLLSILKITKNYRSLYDHYMLLLHDNMKLDENYQASVEKQAFQFPPNSSWIVMTDSVSHAALSGQYALEQTFYLPVKGMQKPELSPLRILERKLGKKLA